MDYLVEYKTILIATASSLFILLIRNVFIRGRDKRNRRHKIIGDFTLFANSIIANLEDFNIKAVVTINNSFNDGTTFIVGLCRVINKRKVIAITELWEQYKYETFYNNRPGKKVGESISTGTSDQEQRKKAICFLNKIIETTK